MMESYRLDELFTEDEIKMLLDIYRTSRSHAAMVQAVMPLMEKINDVTGQDNDASYIAYALEYSFSLYKG